MEFWWVESEFIYSYIYAQSRSLRSGPDHELLHPFETKKILYQRKFLGFE